MSANLAITDGIAADRSFFGHPRGLLFIVFTEAWERFSFYGMQALLVLYMAGYLLHPQNVAHVAGFAAFRAVIEDAFGHLSIEAMATQIFGLYGGLIYFMPVLGGLVGDRVLGRRRAVVVGAVLMALGHFMMAFEATFLVALLSLILGCGLLKGNLAAQVGALYPKDDSRQDAGFSIYFVSINIGASIAPLVCGTLGEVYGWHYGFAAAGVGMLIGLGIYLSGSHYLPADPATSTKTARERLSPGEIRIVLALLSVLLVLTLFWTAQSQVWDTYPLWIRDRVDRHILGFVLPITWFQAIDSFAVLVLAPPILWFWRQQARRGTEPGDLIKIPIGCAVFAFACFWLSLGEIASSGKVLIFWPVAFHFICACGYLYTAPTGLALFSRTAPASINAMMVGVYYLGLFAGSIASGWLGRFYQVLPSSAFWMMHGGIALSGSALMLVAMRPLARLLGGKGGAQATTSGRPHP